MTREQMLNELKKIDLRAIATVATEDMGIQYDYANSEGSGTGFGGMGSWPAHIIRKMDGEKWKAIRSAIKESRLQEEDLEGTDLSPFVDDISSRKGFELSDALSGLMELPDVVDAPIYCLYDQGMWYEHTDKPQFFVDEAAFKKAFADAYVDFIRPWEDMGDEELEYWYDRLQDDLEEFDYVTYDMT